MLRRVVCWTLPTKARNELLKRPRERLPRPPLGRFALEAHPLGEPEGVLDRVDLVMSSA